MINGLQIELTNKCTLKCPRCSRTDFIKQFPKQWKNTDINLQDLKRFIDIDLAGKMVLLSGNYGDPIYHNDMIEVVRFLKERQARIRIATNGSYKSIEWWKELADVLTKDDEIVFAIDGLPKNFTKYRINGDWKSIADGIRIMRESKVTMSWQYIRFSYNIDDVNTAETLSKQLGFDSFTVMDSNRWDNGTEWLTPNINNVSLAKVRWKQLSEKNVVEIDPVCANNQEHFISAEGRYTPCCHAAEHRFYYKTKFYKEKNAYDIKETTLSAVLNYPTTVEFVKTIHTAKPEVCTFSCPKAETDV
jgi:MoaA/NifB/PqqE/SkfB family radical SAM enzyme